MKVLIVGAGMQGQVLTWNLGRNPAVTEIVVADYDEERAAFVAGQVGNGKALSTFINAADTDAVAKAGEGCKLIVNAVIPEFNKSIMTACLKCGAAYIDMAQGQTRAQTIDEAYLDQMTLAPEFAKQGQLRPPQHRHGPGRHQHLRRQRLRGPRQVLRDPHQGLRPVRLAGAAAGVVAGDLLHRLLAAAAALRGRRVQARRDLRPPREVRVPRAVRPRHRHLPRPRRGHHPAAPAPQGVRRQGPALRRLQDGRRRGRQRHRRRPRPRRLGHDQQVPGQAQGRQRGAADRRLRRHPGRPTRRPTSWPGSPSPARSPTTASSPSTASARRTASRPASATTSSRRTSSGSTARSPAPPASATAPARRRASTPSSSSRTRSPRRA